MKYKKLAIVYPINKTLESIEFEQFFKLIGYEVERLCKNDSNYETRANALEVGGTGKSTTNDYVKNVAVNASIFLEECDYTDTEKFEIIKKVAMNDENKEFLEKFYPYYMENELYKYLYLTNFLSFGDIIDIRKDEKLVHKDKMYYVLPPLAEKLSFFSQNMELECDEFNYALLNIERSCCAISYPLCEFSKNFNPYDLVSKEKELAPLSLYEADKEYNLELMKKIIDKIKNHNSNYYELLGDIYSLMTQGKHDINTALYYKEASSVSARYKLTIFKKHSYSKTADKIEELTFFKNQANSLFEVDPNPKNIALSTEYDFEKMIDFFESKESDYFEIADIVTLEESYRMKARNIYRDENLSEKSKSNLIWPIDKVRFMQLKNVYEGNIGCEFKKWYGEKYADWAYDFLPSWRITNACFYDLKDLGYDIPFEFMMEGYRMHKDYWDKLLAPDDKELTRKRIY